MKSTKSNRRHFPRKFPFKDAHPVNITEIVDKCPADKPLGIQTRIQFYFAANKPFKTLNRRNKKGTDLDCILCAKEFSLSHSPTTSALSLVIRSLSDSLVLELFSRLSPTFSNMSMFGSYCLISFIKSCVTRNWFWNYDKKVRCYRLLLVKQALLKKTVLFSNGFRFVKRSWKGSFLFSPIFSFANKFSHNKQCRLRLYIL